MSSDIHSVLVGETWRKAGMVAKASGSAITVGTVNYYLKALSGANAGKWWKNADQTWAVAETANAMTHQADGHWSINLAATPFADGILYLEYAKESGDLHVAGEGRLSRGKAVLDSVSLGAILGTALTETSGGYLAAAFKKLFDVATPVLTAASADQTGDAYAVVAHVDHGNAKLVRSATPANALAVDGAGKVAVPDTQKVDVETIKTKAVAVNSGGTTFPAAVGTSTHSAADVVTAIGTGSTLTALGTAANQTTILSRLGAITGSGVNTILGFFKALLSKTASTPSDIGGTFDPATDSTEGIRDTAPLGTPMRGTDNAALESAWTATRAGYLDNLNTRATEARLAELDAANMPADLDTLKTRLPQALVFAGADVKATLDGETVSVGDKTGYKLAADGFDLILVETGTGGKANINARQALSLMGAVLMGLLDDAGENAPVFKGMNSNVTRATGTTDADGRSAVTLTPPA